MNEAVLHPLPVLVDIGRAPAATDAEPSRKQQQIIDAAAALFMQHGYGSVSMDAVARTAGVSKATLYAHFPSKDALFATIVADACRRNTIRDDNFPDHVDDIAAALRRIGRRGLRFLLQERTLAIHRIVIAEAVRFPELGQAFMANGPRAFKDRLTGWIAEQSRAGRLATPDPLVAAEQFLALMKSGVFMRASLGLPPAPTDAEIDATVDAAIHTFLCAFGPKPPG